MKKFILGFIAGAILVGGVTLVLAKYESESADANSIVGYGHYKNGGTVTILSIRVDTSGIIQAVPPPSDEGGGGELEV